MSEIQIIGTLYSADGQALAGWHVNATGELAGLAAHRVMPSTPRVLFAGIETWCYSFDSQEQAELLLASIDLADPPALKVRAVTMRQARLWLHRAGLLEAVEAAVAAASDPEIPIWWNYSSEVHIGAAPLAVLLPALGLAAEQLPAIFFEAAQL